MEKCYGGRGGRLVPAKRDRFFLFVLLLLLLGADCGVEEFGGEG